MKVTRLIFTLLLVAGAVGSASAQVDPAELGRVDEEIAVMEATLARLNPDLTALERALASPGTMTWMTSEGWKAATTEELVAKVAFLQMAAARPETRDRAERIAGMELPPALATMATERTDRPAHRLVREWSDAEGDKNRKEVAAHQQGLKRTIKMTESWLAEHRAARQAALQPTAQPSSFPQGRCYVPPGSWAVDSSREVLEITTDKFVIAKKTKGSRNMPAGTTSFYIHVQSCFAGKQTAEEGYVNPSWERGPIELRWLSPGTQFSIEWPGRSTAVYTKAD